MTIKIGIVGAEENKWTKEQKIKAKMKICNILTDVIEKLYPDRKHVYPKELKSIVLVSGRCPNGGVDIWAEEIADELGIQKEIYPAEVKQWSDKQVFAQDSFVWRKGFRSRNIQIAEACDMLYDVEPKGSCKYCDGIRKTDKKIWTQDCFIYADCQYCKGTGNYSGGTWTKNYAHKLGKETHVIVIE